MSLDRNSRLPPQKRWPGLMLLDAPKVHPLIVIMPEGRSARFVVRTASVLLRTTSMYAVCFVSTSTRSPSRRVANSNSVRLSFSCWRKNDSQSGMGVESVRIMRACGSCDGCPVGRGKLRQARRYIEMLLDAVPALAVVDAQQQVRVGDYPVARWRSSRAIRSRTRFANNAGGHARRLSRV